MDETERTYFISNLDGSEKRQEIESERVRDKHGPPFDLLQTQLSVGILIVFFLVF